VQATKTGLDTPVISRAITRIAARSGSPDSPAMTALLSAIPALQKTGSTAHVKRSAGEASIPIRPLGKAALVARFISRNGTFTAAKMSGAQAWAVLHGSACAPALANPLAIHSSTGPGSAPAP